MPAMAPMLEVASARARAAPKGPRWRRARRGRWLQCGKSVGPSEGSPEGLMVGVALGVDVGSNVEGAGIIEGKELVDASVLG